MYKISSQSQLDTAFVLLEYYEKGLISENPDYELVFSNYVEVLNLIFDYLLEV